jgi:hypothetical protein
MNEMAESESRVECLALLFRIREVPGSNLCPEAGYRDRG